MKPSRIFLFLCAFALIFSACDSDSQETDAEIMLGKWITDTILLNGGNINQQLFVAYSEIFIEFKAGNQFSLHGTPVSGSGAEAISIDGTYTLDDVTTRIALTPTTGTLFDMTYQFVTRDEVIFRFVTNGELFATVVGNIELTAKRG